MRLELVILPDALDGVLADLLSPGQGARAPVGGPLGFGVQGGLDDAGNHLAVEGGLASTAWLDLPDTADTMLHYPTTPQRHGPALDLQRLGDVLVFLAFSRQKGDPRPKHDLLGCGAGPHPLLEAGNFSCNERNQRRLAWHSPMPVASWINDTEGG